ncbi:hypothetical protein ATCC90586_006005 [Pythium insidiosum]|nr:hypothetical protein ATCC90586_006005 [Pythium insidiosum]
MSSMADTTTVATTTAPLAAAEASATSAPQAAVAEPDAEVQPRRFAPKAAKAATADSRAPVGGSSSSLVFLRVKRKRHEDPVECLLVQGAAPELKRQNVASAGKTDDAKALQRDVVSAFSQLSTRERGVVFKRVDTLEPHQVRDGGDAKWTERIKRKAKAMNKASRESHKKMTGAVKSAVQPTSAQSRAQQQQLRGRERRQSEVLRSRGLLPTAMKEQQSTELGGGVRVVDIAAVSVAADDAETKPAAALTVTLNGATLKPKRVLNPLEREIDEAVWHAFQHNDFSRFFRLYHSRAPDSRVDPAAFQRPADGGSILMAAALHGRADVIEAVLRSSAASVLQEDWHGATPAAFARQAGHSNIEAALRACEAAEREKEFVYDVYCVDMAAMSHPVGAAGVPQAAGDDAMLASAPVVSVSSAVQGWLAQDGGAWNGRDGEDDVDELLLDSDAESNVDDDQESIDSNDESYFLNDYPDEESDGDASDLDSDDDDLTHGPRRMQAARHHRFDHDQTAGDVEAYDY